MGWRAGCGPVTLTLCKRQASSGCTSAAWTASYRASVWAWWWAPAWTGTWTAASACQVACFGALSRGLRLGFSDAGAGTAVASASTSPLLGETGRPSGPVFGDLDRLGLLTCRLRLRDRRGAGCRRLVGFDCHSSWGQAGQQRAGLRRPARARRVGPSQGLNRSASRWANGFVELSERRRLRGGLPLSKRVCVKVGQRVFVERSERRGSRVIGLGLAGNPASQLTGLSIGHRGSRGLG